MIGILLVLFTRYKLIKKDKERESEINSLFTIAERLMDMQVEAERRYRTTKKPHIGIELQTAPVGNRIQIHFTNSNTNLSITKYEITNEVIDLTNMNYTTEEGYTFIQDIIIWKRDDRYIHSPRVIIDKENSVV